MIHDEQLHEMAAALIEVPGVRAVVLGGSRARGTHHDGSDVDLGLYYDHGSLDVPALSAATVAFADGGRVDVSGPGSWGPWVDGGGWLTVQGTAVDWILRDLARVGEQCDRALRGEFGFHPQPGHPLGFLDVSYAGEVATCVPLADPESVITDLKAALDPYPSALQHTMTENLWQAEFLVGAAGKGIAKRDIAYVLLCCTNALMTCAHAWHAAAGEWATNEKGLVVDVARLAVDTCDFAALASDALACPTSERQDLATTISATRDLVSLTMRSLNGPSATS